MICNTCLICCENTEASDDWFFQLRLAVAEAATVNPGHCPGLTNWVCFYPGIVADGAGFAILSYYQRAYDKLPILKLALFFQIV